MKLRYISLCVLAAASVVAVAQDLSKEITVEKEIVPEKRVVTRMATSSSVTLPAVTQKRLTFSEYRQRDGVAPQLAFLEPAAYADSLTVKPFRGYIDFGYFPIYNTALSAGYKIVDTERTRLGVWTQYDGKIYDGNLIEEPFADVTMRSHQVEAGIDFAQRVGGQSLLSVDADYHYGLFNTPYYSNEKVNSHNQSVNQVDVQIGWSSKAGKVKYAATIGYGHFGYAHAAMAGIIADAQLLAPVRENSWTLNGYADYIINECSELGLDIDASMVDYNRNSAFASDENGVLSMREAAEPDYGIIALSPHLDYNIGVFAARLGARVDVCINSGRALYVAPDVKVDWKPFSWLAVYGHLGGGQQMNKLGELYDMSQHTASMMAYGRSSVPFTADAGVMFGPWRGAGIKIYGQYGIAKDWLMPSLVDGIAHFAPVDVDGWLIGVEAQYNYRDVVKVKAGYEMAPQNCGDAYYLWRDRACNVLNASLTVTPISALDIEVGYERRDGSKLVSLTETYDLKTADNLVLGAKYRINDQFNVWARLENVLNTRYYMISGLPAQGFTGLVGVGYKF